MSQHSHVLCLQRLIHFQTRYPTATSILTCTLKCKTLDTNDASVAATGSRPTREMKIQMKFVVMKRDALASSTMTICAWLHSWTSAIMMMETILSAKAATNGLIAIT